MNAWLIFFIGLFCVVGVIEVVALIFELAEYVTKQWKKRDHDGHGQ